MDLDEMGALMGYDAQSIEKLVGTGISKGIIGHALGNGPTPHVVERLLVAVLYSAGLVQKKPKDIWKIAASLASKLCVRPDNFLTFVSQVRQQECTRAPCRS